MRDVVVSLFDKTGNMVKPWRDAGYECWIVDTQHPTAYADGGVTVKDGMMLVHANLVRPWLPSFERSRIAFVSAFPPCDHLAVSGSRWFRGKGLRLLADSIHLFATAAEFCEWAGAPYIIENPVSNIASHWRKPDHYFSPEYFTAREIEDNYTKKTCLWIGHGFVMPPAEMLSDLPPPDDRIHKATPGPDRADFRSKTPMGFARATHAANGQAIPATQLSANCP